MEFNRLLSSVISIYGEPDLSNGLKKNIEKAINKQKNMRSEIPFGPFIIAACLIYFTYGDFLYSLILV